METLKGIFQCPQKPTNVIQTSQNSPWLSLRSLNKWYGVFAPQCYKFSHLVGKSNSGPSQMERNLCRRKCLCHFCPAMRWPLWLHMIPGMGCVSGLAQGTLLQLFECESCPDKQRGLPLFVFIPCDFVCGSPNSPVSHGPCMLKDSGPFDRRVNTPSASDLQTCQIWPHSWLLGRPSAATPVLLVFFDPKMKATHSPENAI